MRLREKKDKSPGCSAVIAAAGVSKRMGGVDKLLLDINGAPVLVHSLKQFQNSNCISEIIVVSQSMLLKQITELCNQFGITKITAIIPGGSTRLESVLAGVYSTSKTSRFIAVHDGARPCVSEAIIHETVTAAVKYNAAAPGIQITSTVKRANNGVIVETIDRENLFEIQTPQVFASELIKAALTNAYRKSIAITDDCMAVELLGAAVHITKGSPDNIKLTSPDDIPALERILHGVE